MSCLVLSRVVLSRVVLPCLVLPTISSLMSRIEALRSKGSAFRVCSKSQRGKRFKGLGLGLRMKKRRGNRPTRNQ
jgi:hypothetical protein